MTASSSTPDPAASANVSEDDPALLIAALGHAWSWYDSRISRGLQVVNYFLVATAILATAYVSAINAKLYTVAAVIGLSGIALTAVSFTAGLHQRRLGAAGEPALAELQDRIATTLGIDTFRMATSKRASFLRYAPSVIAFGLAAALDIGAVFYALSR